MKNLSSKKMMKLINRKFFMSDNKSKKSIGYVVIKKTVIKFCDDAREK